MDAVALSACKTACKKHPALAERGVLLIAVIFSGS